MAIVKCCKNCIYCECDLNCSNNKGAATDYCLEYDYCIEHNYELFAPKEAVVRQDERAKVIDELWLTIADPDKKIYFEKDGYKFEIALQPTKEE